MPDASPLRRLAARLTRLWGGAYAVLERDFLVLTSTRLFLVLRLCVALVATVVVAIVAMAEHRSPPDEVGRAVLGAAVVVVPLLLFLVAPAASAPAISSEREGGTLDLVLAAPVGAATFVGAKFAARFLAIGVLVFAMLPVAGVCFLYGGVPFDTFLALVVFSLTIVAFCVATGLAFSAFLRSPAAAVLGAFLFVLLAPPLPLAVLGLLHATGLRIEDDWFELLLPLQPLYAWGELTDAAFQGVSARVGVWPHAAVMSCVSVLLLAVAVWRMRREGRVPRKARRRREARGIFLGSPLLDRAVRGSLLWHPRKRGFVLPGLALVGDGMLVWAAYSEHALDQGWVHVAALGSMTVLGMVRMLATTSASIASERRRGSLDVLMATPFRPDQVVQGAVAGALLSTSPLFLLGLVHGTVAAALGGLHGLAVIAWAAVSAILLLFAGAVGLRASVSATSPTRSALWSFGTFFGGMVLVLVCGFVIGVTTHEGDLVAALLLSLPPVLAYYVPFLGDAVMRDEWFRVRDWEMLVPLAAPLLFAAVLIVLLRRSVRVLEERRG